MLRTYAESEIPLPSALARNGERSWHWVELPLYITYFLVTFRVRQGANMLGRTLLFSDIRSVLQIAGEAIEDHRLERVDVLIPAYLHGGTGYRLAQIKEVWESDGDHPAVSFVLDDGASIFDSCCEGEHAHGANLKLVARL
ncbi:MAG: hypothetical protein HZC22_07160 [Rhodocyclales bacterium]|nr:hypothetical protein [Rhodocyclales bacterium]